MAPSAGGESCEVILRCSGDGIMCGAFDRACRDHAREKGLQISCETATHDYVYCPEQGKNQDHPVLWVLLGFAGLIAVVGMTIAWYVMRGVKPSAGSTPE